MRCMCVYWHCIATQCAAIAEERNPLCLKQVGKAVHYLEKTVHYLLCALQLLHVTALYML